MVKKIIFFMKITTFRGTQSAFPGEKMWSEIHVGGYGNNANDVIVTSFSKWKAKQIDD